VEQLAAMLGVQPSTVSHHLTRLAEVGLVSARAEGYYSVYRLETGALETMARRLLAREALPSVAAGVDLNAYDRKVLADFTGPDGRLRSLPAQRKKLLVVLRHAARLFEPGLRYPEQQVNEILGRLHEDTALLRRELVGGGWLARERNVYWRVDPQPEMTHASGSTSSS
jgi:hypothetical protein